MIDIRKNIFLQAHCIIMYKTMMYQIKNQIKK
jgi:hypothetical protein